MKNLNKFLEYDTDTGKLKRIYIEGVHKNIPENVISITNTDENSILNIGKEKFRLDLSSKEIIPYEKPEKQKLEELYTNKCNEIKSKCSQEINNLFPLWKQQNFITDKENLINKIIDKNEISYNGVLKNIYGIIDINNLTLEDLENFDNDILIEKIKKYGIIDEEISKYYEKLILIYLNIRKIELLREWSNEKEKELNMIYERNDILDKTKITRIKNLDLFILDEKEK